MALSQIQCLDENHVNPRTHENKPEFLYCENQRLALEVLLQDGREAFHGFLKARELRGFLSDSELDVLTRLVVPYDPGSDVLHASPLEDSGDGEDGVPLSLHYWPDLSDTSVPELDLGWPDSASYRGVTRTTVYTQPPQEGQAHIKEIIRRTIAQATKVIAVVMDLFTDVNIFRDLLEAGYKRKVSVYILLEPSTLPHFLSMCDRAKMHPGQLKNLRVRCAGGGEFLTRSCTRLRGRLGHRFMFVDGDKAVSGSYRYTWMSSRLDRHLITVVTGQAVDAFDRLFCELYGTSSAVDLKQVAMEPEPEPEFIPQPVAVAPSAEVTRKRHNPMYALLGMSMNNANPASGSVPNSPLDSNTQDKVGMGTKAKRKMAAKAAQVEAPPLHPGLMDMEKAYMIPYLPTWPEPDPDSDVIGFINVRDNSRQSQVHMQRSERFETSQAIRFSSPFSMPKEILPEVAQLKHRDSNLQDITGKKAYPTQASPIAVYQQNAAPPVQTQNRIANKVSCKQDLGTKPQSPSKEDYIPSIPSPTLSGTISASTVSPTQPPFGRFTSPYVTTSVSVTSSPSRSIIKSPVVPPASPSISSPLPFSSISSSYFNPSMNVHSTNTSPLPCSGPSTSPLTPPVPKPRTVHLLMDSGRKCNVLNQPLDCGVVMEHRKLSGFGPVMDDCKPVSKQQEDAFMTSTRKQISPKTVVNSTTKYAELQERRDIKTHLLNDVKDGSYREFPDPKKATKQMPQSILTVNTLQANDNQFEDTRPKESGNTNQAGFMVRSPRVIEELSKPDKVRGQRGVKTYPFNDEAVNNVHYGLNPDKGKAENDSRTPEKPTRPHNLELTSPTTAGRLSPRTPTRRTPDGRSCSSPDSRTPTPDTSDGYVSSKEDSERSTTSDEYYECDETRRPSPVFDRGIGLDNSFKAQTKYGVGSEGESEREYKVWIGNDRAAILAAGEQSRRGSEGLSQTAKKGSLLPLKTTKQEKSLIYNSPQSQSDPLEPLGVDGYPRSASAKKSADIETSPPPIFRQILRRSSSSASSENTVSPFITPVPSPAPTPTPKRAAAQPRAPPPDTVVAGPAVVSGPRVQPEAKQVIRRDSRGESAELTRKWEEGWNFRRDEEKDPELFTKGGLGTSSGESHSETSALGTSGAQIRRGPWVPRETEEKKGLQTPPITPQGWPKPPNHHSPVPFQSPAAKPTIPTPPTTVPQLPRSYQQVSSRVDALQTQQNSTPQQAQNRRHSSMTTAGSLEGADQKSPLEAFSRRSLNYGHPLTGQGSGALPKPQPSFLYSYTNSQSQLQRQTQPMIAGDQMAQTVSSKQSTYRQVSAMGDPEPGDSGQDLNKSGFRISVGKLYSIKGLKNKGSSSPSQTKRNPDSLAQPRKSIG
ncbi:unnamed protein product [Boreogadus saida]